MGPSRVGAFVLWLVLCACPFFVARPPFFLLLVLVDFVPPVTCVRGKKSGSWLEIGDMKEEREEEEEVQDHDPPAPVHATLRLPLGIGCRRFEKLLSQRGA